MEKENWEATLLCSRFNRIRATESFYKGEHTIQLERVVNTAKAHTTGRWRSFLATSVAAGAVGLLSRFLVVLFVATVSLTLTATVLAQQRAQNGAQAQGTAKTRAAEELRSPPVSQRNQRYPKGGQHDSTHNGAARSG